MRKPYRVVVNVLDCSLKVSEFKTLMAQLLSLSDKIFLQKA